MNEKKLGLKVHHNEKSSTFAAVLIPLTLLKGGCKDDLVAQQVEHHTFNVGVLGSSPSQVTENEAIPN